MSSTQSKPIIFNINSIKREVGNEADLIDFGPKNFQGKICLSPLVSITISLDGLVSLCGCGAWMPTVIGSIYTAPLKELLANYQARAVRESIADGSFRYCNEKTCGLINNNLLNDRTNVDQKILKLLDNTDNFIMPHEITIAGDKTCNLSCPSCRTGIVKTDDETTEYFERVGKQLKDNIFFQPSNDRIRIHTSTSGEVFASPLLQSFIQSIPIEDYPNLELCLQSNGLLAPSRWDRLGVMADRVTSIIVTVDAARPETYETLRRGGKWEDIQAALSWLSNKKKQNGMQLNIRMVVQNTNYNEMVEFYHMCAQFNADRVEYARIANWNTYSIGKQKDMFFYHDVFDPAHPNFSHAQTVLDQIKQLPNVFLYGGL